MNKVIAIIGAFLLLTISGAQAKTTVYGKGVQLKETTKISDLLDGLSDGR